MHRVEFHKRALKALRRVPQERNRQILFAIAELAELVDPASHQNVRFMQGEWEGSLRLRVGSYRAVFRLEREETAEEDVIIRVTHIGPRGDIYD